MTRVEQVPTAVVVLRALDAVRAQSTPAFVSCFAEDAVLDDCGHHVQGRRAIRTWSQLELTGNHTRVRVDTIMGTGREVHVHASMISTGFNGRVTLTFEVDGDHVTLLRLSD